jgi:hypothetical protein
VLAVVRAVVKRLPPGAGADCIAAVAAGLTGSGVAGCGAVVG